MNKPGSVSGMRFERTRQRVSMRLVAVVVAVALFWLAWTWVPRDAGFLLLVIATAVLTWMASYSWRQAVAAVIRCLHQLEQL
jgi:uncharacterized membrane protein YccC